MSKSTILWSLAGLWGLASGIGVLWAIGTTVNKIHPSPIGISAIGSGFMTVATVGCVVVIAGMLGHVLKQYFGEPE